MYKSKQSGLPAQAGFVWLIVLVVAVVVLGIIWSKRGAVEDGAEQQATSTPLAEQETVTTGPTGSTQSPLPTMTASGAYIVYYGTTGFSPANLNIPLGKSVHFVNNSSNAMLIVPVDKVNRPYANFQQSKSLGKGGTFDYTFTAAGSYGYYNDNKDSHTGVITVR